MRRVELNKNEAILRTKRSQLLRALLKLPEGSILKFRYMYGTRGGTLSKEEVEERPIEDIINEMEVGKLDWAILQVARTKKSMVLKPF